MSGIATAVVAGSVITGVMSSNAQSDAANTAANAQNQSSAASIAESQRQFNQIQELLKPYTQAGTGALTGQQDLLGLNGQDAQGKAISGIAGGQQMQALTAQGENSLRQNASATGGLRGGNLQGALAQFRPQLLNQLIQQQYGNLGGLVSVGQNAAAGVGNAGQNSSNQVINALQQQGAANAGAALAAGQGQANMWSGIGNTASMLGTMKLMGKF
jgi:hypothetical protein